MQGLTLVGISIAICKWCAAWKPTPQFDELGGYRGKYWELFRRKREKTFNPDKPWSNEEILGRIDQYVVWRNFYERLKYDWWCRILRTKHKTIRDQFYDYWNWYYVAIRYKYISTNRKYLHAPIMTMSRGGIRVQAAEATSTEPMYIFWFEFFCADYHCLDVYLVFCFLAYTCAMPYYWQNVICAPFFNPFDKSGTLFWGNVPPKQSTMRAYYGGYVGWPWDNPMRTFLNGRLRFYHRLLKRNHVYASFEPSESDYTIDSIRLDLLYLVFPCFLFNSCCYWFVDHYLGSYHTDWWILSCLAFSYLCNIIGFGVGTYLRNTGTFYLELRPIGWKDDDFYKELGYCSSGWYRSGFVDKAGNEDPWGDWL